MDGEFVELFMAGYVLAGILGGGAIAALLTYISAHSAPPATVLAGGIIGGIGGLVLALQTSAVATTVLPVLLTAMLLIKALVVS